MNALNTAVKHISRSPYQALAASLTMFLTMLVAGVFFLATFASIYIIGYFESKPQITVFFTDKAGQLEADELQKKLDATGYVSSVKFVSKEEALNIYREQNKNDPLLLEMVTAEILPASIEVSAKDPSYLKDLEPIIKGANGVEEVIYQKDVVDTLLSWTTALRIIGGVLAGLLALNSFLVVMTVIGMKIALKREEVEILTLVGATPSYIRAPFLLEGGFYGVVGAGMAWLVITILILWLRPFLLSFLGGIPAIVGLLSSATITPMAIAALIYLGGLLATGFILGSMASMVAVGRFLRI